MIRINLIGHLLENELILFYLLKMKAKFLIQLKELATKGFLQASNKLVIKHKKRSKIGVFLKRFSFGYGFYECSQTRNSQTTFEFSNEIYPNSKFIFI
jgi:hypothetical protein